MMGILWLLILLFTVAAGSYAIRMVAEQFRRREPPVKLWPASVYD
jgi:hypothetical protein